MSNYINIYVYDKNTKELKYQTVAQLDPKNPGNYLYPPYCTVIEPLYTKPRFTQIYNYNNELWEYVEDNRGKTLFNKQNSLLTIIFNGDLNDLIPSEYTLILPPDLINQYKFGRSKWNRYYQPVTILLLANWLYLQKCNNAYNGLNVVKDHITYKLESDQNSITMFNSMVIALQNTDNQIVTWKVWKEDQTDFIKLTKQLFLSIYIFGINMINNCFQVENNMLQLVNLFTELQLADHLFILQFKQDCLDLFNNIEKEILL